MQLTFNTIPYPSSGYECPSTPQNIEGKILLSHKNDIMGKNQHVVPHDGKWGVKGEGNSKVTVIKDTQKSAIDAAKEIAKNQQSEVVIHGKDGRIRDKDSYGNDPNPPKDTKL